jgi:transposase
MSAVKRKSYTGSFKAKVGLEAIRGGRTVNEIGQAYGVHPAQVRQWKQEIVGGAEGLFGKARGPQPAESGASDERLYAEIGRLKVELDWLKKKSGMSL